MKIGIYKIFKFITMHRYYNTLNKVNVILLITTLFFISCSNDDLALNTPECKEYMQTIQMKLDI